MENRKRFLWYVFLMSIFILPLSGCSLSSRTNSYEEARTLAEEAYVFAFPMLENYRTMQVQAIASDNFNRFRHSTELQQPGQQEMFRPQNDTLNSTLWLDLRAEPMVLTVPPIPDRYFSFQFVDMYTHNFAYISTRTIGTGGGTFLIAGPGWNGRKPLTVDAVLHSEGNFVFCLVRTAVDGPQDLKNVRALQQQYRIRPLSAFLGTPPPQTAASKEAFPFYITLAADSAHFISYLNFILGQMQPHPSEEAMVERFGLIGIGPSFHFNAGEFSGKIRTAVEDGIASAMEQIAAAVPLLGEKKNGWTVSRRIFGDRDRMQNLYLIRAGVAQAGRLYGSDLEEINLHTAEEDADGDPLDASRNSYVLSFSKDDLPPVDAFWSLTMLSSPEQTMVVNPIDRYSIGSRSRSLVYGEDGSLTIYLQKNPPEAEREGNWLPAPDGPFSLTLRMYLPKENGLPPYYAPPPIRKAGRYR